MICLQLLARLVYTGVIVVFGIFFTVHSVFFSLLETTFHIWHNTSIYSALALTPIYTTYLTSNFYSDDLSDDLYSYDESNCTLHFIHHLCNWHVALYYYNCILLEQLILSVHTVHTGDCVRRGEYLNHPVEQFTERLESVSQRISLNENKIKTLEQQYSESLQKIIVLENTVIRMM